MTFIYEQKQQFNDSAKASMREFLRSKSWVEKVESIERMNRASKIAKEAMRKKLSEAPSPAHALTRADK